MEKVSNKMIMRAVELWCRKLSMPSFDNGDDSSTGFMTTMLATMSIKNAQDQVDAPVVIEQFRKELTKALIDSRDSDDPANYFDTYLSVDYGPGKTLADAADKCGLPHNLFSCKSSVSIQHDHVTARFGYGCEGVNHYPLPDGRWLMTSLCGSDIDKVITQVMLGNDLGLEIDA